MKINFSNVLFIVIAGSVIGLLINFLRSDGISLTRKDGKLIWADTLTFNKRINNDSSKINLEKSSPESLKNSLKKNTSSNSPSSEESFKEPIAINLEQAYKLYKNDIIFLDAREIEEYKAGHIKNALSLPYYDFDNYKHILNNIPSNSKIVTYCAGTDCDLSILLGRQLSETGYKRVYIFFGGWNDWLSAKYPIEKN